MTVYGYARVSTTDQSLDIQIAELTAAGCEKVRSEKVSGTSTNGRQELKTLPSTLATCLWSPGSTAWRAALATCRTLSAL